MIKLTGIGNEIYWVNVAHIVYTQVYAHTPNETDVFLNGTAITVKETPEQIAAMCEGK